MIEARASEIREEFEFLDDWEARYAHIIDLGRANPSLDASERVEHTRVRGCCLLYTSPSPRDRTRSRMPSSA